MLHNLCKDAPLLPRELRAVHCGWDTAAFGIFSGALFWGSVGEGRGVEALCDGGEGGCVVVKEGGVGGVHQ